MEASSPVVLITGCSSGGLGAALAAAFDAASCRVFASARRPEAMAGLPDGVQRLTLDVTSELGCAAAVQQVVKAAGRVDILVNNAAVAPVGTIASATLQAYRAALETNVLAPVCLIQQVMPHMQRQGGGTIVNISSALECTLSPFNGMYVSTKWALRCLSDTLRLELPDNINIMHVAPGAIATPMLDAAEMATPSWRAQEAPAGALFAFERCLRSVVLPRATPPEGVARTIMAAALRASGPPACLHTGGLWWLFVACSWLPTWMATLAIRVLYRLLSPGQPERRLQRQQAQVCVAAAAAAAAAVAAAAWAGGS